MPAKGLRDKIKSVKNTRKTTMAMEKVAVSKMLKAQRRMAASRPYADKIYEVIRHLARAHSEHRHPYLVHRPVKNVGYIVVSTDRGLCGGLNINLFKKIVTHMKAYSEQDIKAHLCIIGKKGENFFQRFNANIVGLASHIGDAPALQDLVGIVKVMLDYYEQGKIDKIYLAYNNFVNTMTQTPTVLPLLPLPESEENEVKHYWDYIYEPDNRELMDVLLKRYIESEVYQSVVENFASQQAATMIAMKSASDNAEEIIKLLQLEYNGRRQAAITQEISEIVGGAAAV